MEFKANEKHLENIVFQGLDQQADSLSFIDGQLTIVVDENGVYCKIKR